MAGNLTPKLPPEMFEAIIDQVYSLKEKDSVVNKLLGVFSLVSKSWLPRSRHHLFQRLTIRQNMRTMTKRLLDLLDSPLCSVKPFVRIFELDERLSMRVMDALPRFSVLLPEVQELRIREGRFNIHPYAATVLSTFLNLQILVLDDCYFDSSAQLIEMLSMCRSESIKRIGFNGLTMTHRFDSPGAVINSPPPSSLKFIQMRNNSVNNDMMEWLVSGEQVPAIETLDVSIIREDEFRTIGRGLRRLGPCLKNLKVQFKLEGSTQNALLRDVDLSYNTNLNAICFKSGPVASLLAQVTSFTVREIAVDIGWASLREVDWRTVARILDQPNFSKLERLIIPGVWYKENRVRRWMMQRLLPGRARDKLVLVRSGLETVLDSGILYM